MQYLDFIFPPSLTRITRSFERTRSRLAAFAARQNEKGMTLRSRADELHLEANAVLRDADRATSIALKFDNLLS